MLRLECDDMNPTRAHAGGMVVGKFKFVPFAVTASHLGDNVTRTHLRKY